MARPKSNTTRRDLELCLGCGELRDGPHLKCAKCRKLKSEYDRKRRLENSEKLREYDRIRGRTPENLEKRRVYRRKHRTGVTSAQFQTALEKQDNRCAICRHIVHTQRGVYHDQACADHCHKTKAFRGVLCRKCNFGVGHFKDSPEIMKRAIQYLLTGEAILAPVELTEVPKKTGASHTRLKMTGVDHSTFHRAVKAQEGCCSICKREFTSQILASADHTHVTGKFRGVLCRLCNSGLGWFKDSPELLQSAIAYLQPTKR